MPELPEVETIKRELERAVLGKKITEVCVHHPRVIRGVKPELFRKMLKGVSIKKIVRKAKLLIFELSNAKALTIHLKMTGQLIYPGKDSKETRVCFHLSNGKKLSFNDRRIFGELRIMDDWRTLKFVKELGPEPYDITVEQFKDLLDGKKTKIKPLLMDQTFISGLGNLYVAEALFRARLDPARHANSLSDKEKEVLFTEILATLDEAIRYKGSSIDQYVQLSGEPGSFVAHHKVYDKEGKPCPRCRTPVKRISLGGRGTYFCSQCQR